MVGIDQIQEFSSRPAETFHPLKIVLFGSYAEGTATEDSDVDLLVILPFEGKSVSKSVEMRLKLRPCFPLDLIVRTPENVQERLEMGDSFMMDVLEEGKVLYEAHNG
jgi:predicted nucleotidyltransferase